MTIDHLTETATMSLRVGAATDVGRVRDHNEDAALAEHSVFLVADGMGGHAAGEVASQMVVDAMREIASLESLTVDDLVAQLEVANRRIIDEAEIHPERRGMGTTATGLAVVSTGGADHWAVFNVGDSRVYRFIDGQLARDGRPPEVQELTDAGSSPRPRPVHLLRNVVTRSLG